MKTKLGSESTVVGLFSDRADAQRAVRELRDAAFREDQIGILARDGDVDQVTERASSGHAGAGAAAGAMAGAGVGGLWALGIAAGMLPAIGPVIAGGLFASLLASAATGAAAGGIAGALIGAGVPDEEAEQYEEPFRAGRTLVTVREGGSRAADILRRCDGEVRSHNSHANALQTGAACTVPSTERQAAEGERSVQLRAEELDVQKRPVEKGEVRLRKEVVHETKSIDVPVTREELVIDRHPVHGSAAAGAIESDARDIRIPVREEEVSVEKRPVVKEEVTVGKQTIHDTKRVSADLQREELRVETKGDVRTNEIRPR
jgi:uncharacterized protein (TIGR02271 family)